MLTSVRVTLVSCLLGLLWASSSAGESRTWTDSKGRELQAELLWSESGVAVLKTADGKQVQVPLENLSDADRKYVTTLQALRARRRPGGVQEADRGKAPTRGPAEGKAWTVPELGLELIWVAPGTFQMGSNDPYCPATPVHAVRISRGYGLGGTK